MSASRKTRILYVNHTGLVSGAEKVLIDILRGLNRDRYEPDVTCPSQGGLAAEVLGLGIAWLPMPAIEARFAGRPGHVLHAIAPLFRSVAELRKQIRMLSPDLIHANSIRAGIVASLAAMGTGKPVIWHVHDTLPRHPLSTAIRACVLLRRRTRVIAVSNSTAAKFRGRFPLGKKVRTIYNGVDLSRFPPRQPGRPGFRESLGLSDDDFLVCAIGQICARKGLLELVGAVRRIIAQAPQIHLVLVGKVVFPHEEDYLDDLRAAVTASGIDDRIHFAGELRDVSPVLQAANLLVLNSRDEPFGLVVIESMASGTPVLATRVGGIPEIVTDAEDGWLIESGDTSALALKLLELSRNRGALLRVAERAQLFTCSRFSLERFQSDISNLYSELDPNNCPARSVRSRPALAGSGNN
ncbi:MAG: glycosyltransferase family 4 protein [Terracidiphilus sp.]